VSFVVKASVFCFSPRLRVVGSFFRQHSPSVLLVSLVVEPLVSCFSPPLRGGISLQTELSFVFPRVLCSSTRLSVVFLRVSVAGFFFRQHSPSVLLVPFVVEPLVSLPFSSPPWWDFSSVFVFLRASSPPWWDFSSDRTLLRVPSCPWWLSPLSFVFLRVSAPPW
jgi:hypothetical protein